ncbi:MAG: hypothetical protein ACI353_06150 [Alloprevotella sp.]
MKLLRHIAVCLMAVTLLPLSAQPKTSAAKRKTTRPEKKISRPEKNFSSEEINAASAGLKASASADVKTAWELFADYRFEEAKQCWEEEKLRIERAKLPTWEIEAAIERAELGANLLSVTQKVEILDSTSVDAAAFLNSYRLSRETGRLADARALLKSMKVPVAGTGRTAFMSELGDRILFAAPDEAARLRLCSSGRLGEEWGTPEQLEFVDGVDGNCDYPFLQADGVTLYFASDNEDGLGGYDLYVSTYDSDTRQFSRPENLGFPFNSPADDYLYVIDEEQNIGYFATNRRQPEGKVCVYTFRLPEVRETFILNEDNEDEVRAAAMILGLEKPASPDGKAKLTAASQQQRTTNSVAGVDGQIEMRFIINDYTVYTSLNDFRSDDARTAASQVHLLSHQLADLQRTLAENRERYAANDADAALRDIIRSQEQQERELSDRLTAEAKRMRALENKAVEAQKTASRP